MAGGLKNSNTADLEKQRTNELSKTDAYGGVSCNSKRNLDILFLFIY